MTPSNPQNAYDLLLASFVDPNPIIFMEHKLIYKLKSDVNLGPMPSDSSALGKSKVVKEGSDITIASYSNMVNTVINATKDESLGKYSIEVIDLLTLSPLDSEKIIESVEKTKKLLVCQEAPASSSIGSTLISEVVSSRAFKALTQAPEILAGLHSPMPSAKHLETTVIPQEEDIVKKIKEMMSNE